MNDDMPRKLPLHVTRERTRHGKVVFYFRVGNGKRRRLPQIGTPEFDIAYQAFLTGGDAPKPVQSDNKSLQWLVDRYTESSEWVSLSKGTHRQRMNIFKEAIARSGNPKYQDITPEVMKLSVVNRAATPAQANNFLKAFRILFDWAKRNNKVDENPCDKVLRLKYKSNGFPAWTAKDLQKFCTYWEVGTIPRLAIELLVQTGLRRSDIVFAGRQHLKGNIFSMRTQKTNALITVEFPERLLEIIDLTKTGDMTFITGEHGSGFTVESFGNWFREKCDEAGVKGSAHGVRKLSATMAVDGGATAHELMSQYGWANARQAETYTRNADRARLGKSSSKKVAEQMEAINPRTKVLGAGKIEDYIAKSIGEK